MNSEEESRKRKHEALKEAYDSFPRQDNEGYILDRGGFKTGFLMGWDAANKEKVDNCEVGGCGCKGASRGKECLDFHPQYP